VPALEIAQAAETTMRVLAKHKTRTAYIWTFLGRDADDKEIIAYQFSPTRSGETPVRVLGDSKGKCVVDAFSGYNKVTTPAGRLRCGCIAHARRKFFEALPKAEDAARTALDFILEIYKVEEEAKQRGIAQVCAQPVAHAHRVPRRSSSASGQQRFRGRAPRCGSGTKEFLFVGHDKAGENLAGLYSLVATCEANGVNPAAYLTDVLVRLQTHPASRIDELLPHHWRPPPRNSS